MSTHTPGPWQWFDYPDGRKLLAGNTRAVIHCPDAPMTCEPSDMALIAIAPDMLVALRDLMNVITADELIHESVSYMRQAQAVLAKAE
jgi:hypothetical protein